MKWGREAAALAVECKTFYPLRWESASPSFGRQRKGRFHKGGQPTAKARDTKGIRGQGWIRNALSTERLEGRSLHWGYFQLAALQIQQSLALPEKHEIAADQVLVSCYSSKVK